MTSSRADGRPLLTARGAAQHLAAAKVSLEQGLPLTEGLFGDLALEHQLLERTRFAKMLAEQAG